MSKSACKRCSSAAERVEHMSRVGAVGQLFYDFAHEMRQPLAAISLYVFRAEASRSIQRPDARKD